MIEKPDIRLDQSTTAGRHRKNVGFKEPECPESNQEEKKATQKAAEKIVKWCVVWESGC